MITEEKEYLATFAYSGSNKREFFDKKFTCKDSEDLGQVINDYVANQNKGETKSDRIRLWCVKPIAPPAPAAPDKGEELLQKVDKITEDAKAKLDVRLQQIIDRDYSVEKSEGEEAALESEPVVVERFADNGEHSHWDLVDRDTGQTIWSEDPDFPRKLLKYASDRNNSSGDRGRKEWPTNNNEQQQK